MSNPAQMENLSVDGLDVHAIKRDSFTQYYITANVDTDDQYSMFDKLASFATKNNATIITQHVFGGVQHQQDGLEALEKAAGKIDWPITWIQGDCCNGEDLTGTQAYAISGADVEKVMFNGKAVGAVFEDEDARYCLLGDIRPDDLTKGRGEQTAETFEKMEAILQTIGMNFLNVARTWLYLDDLLSWYDELNDVRTKFFNDHGVFDKMVPASTGIGVCNPAGAALVTDVFAIEPKTDKISIKAVESPLQCSARDYKSSFSRAVEVALPDHRTIYVSGSASIEPEGESVHIGDTEKQIDLTMRVVHAILDSNDMDWSDTVRAIGYFKDIDDAPLLDKYCKENNIPPLPLVLSHSDVCRDELLFEIEIDAVKTA